MGESAVGFQDGMLLFYGPLAILIPLAVGENHGERTKRLELALNSPCQR